LNQSKFITLLALAFSSATLHAAEPSADRYIVKFAPGKSGEARAALSRSAARVMLELPAHDAVAVDLPAAALAGLSRNPNIEYVEQDVPRYPLALATPSTGSPYFTGQLVPYGIPMVQADQVSDSLLSNRKVCIIDSGYNLGHEDLPGASTVSGDNDSGTGLWSTDENQHGTHVAGTVVAVNNSGVGVVGVNPNGTLRLHIVKVFGADGWAYSSTLTAAVDKCAAAGANVISMSLGGSLSSRTESNAFDKYYKRTSNSILSIAAAGNAGNTRTSYPAGYTNVVSVAAIDENKNWATFSQYNKDVEIAAPGVGVLSTVPMGTGRESALSVAGTAITSAAMNGSPPGIASGPLVDCGTGTSVCPAATGKVCLIQRGTNAFADKVLNCQAGGGIAAVIYNNAAGMLYGTLGDTATTIASMGISDADGALLKTRIGATADAAVNATSYAYFDGTSMATPHVSAVAALVWSHRPGCSAATVRNVLNATAIDLGAAGRDNKFGYGLVQANAAKTRLLSAAVSCP